jgi:hypothetical protein
MLYQTERVPVRIHPRIDLASKHPSGGPNCEARHDASDILTDTCPPSVLSSPAASGNARPSAGWHGQRPDPLEHRPEQPPRQMALPQQEPVVPSMFHQPPTRLDEALLETGERPVVRNNLIRTNWA